MLLSFFLFPVGHPEHEHSTSCFHVVRSNHAGQRNRYELEQGIEVEMLSYLLITFQVEALQEGIGRLRLDIKEAKGRGEEKERQQREQGRNSSVLF